MKKKVLFSLITFLLFFTLSELTFRVFSPPGAYSFLERRFIEEKLTAKKGPDEIRIFLFGESTMHGCNLYPKSTIKKWMDMYLEKIIGEKNAQAVKIFNFGRLGEDSDFMVNAFAQTLPYKPDIVVFYSAHNDFGLVDHRNRVVHGIPFSEKIDIFFSELIRKSSFISFFNRLHVRSRLLRHRQKDKKNKYSEGFKYIEIDRSFSDKKKGLIDTESDSFGKIINKWKKNIYKIIELGQKNKIPVIFFEGVANFKDFGPSSSVHRKGIAEEWLDAWKELDRRADKSFSVGRYDQASQFYNECLGLDDQFAKTYYCLGQCYENLGYYEKANKYYKLSNDYDRFPARGHSFVNQFYEDILSRGLSGIYVIQTQELFEENAFNGIVDAAFISDPVHPTIKGQSLMASAILEIMYDKKLLPQDIVWDWNNMPDSYLELYDNLGIDREFLFFYYFNKAKYLSPRYYDAAIRCAEKALEIDPNSLSAQRLLAWVFWVKGDKDKALIKYEELYKKAPAVMEKVFLKYPEIKQELTQ